jgi:hypothetical protein
MPYTVMTSSAKMPASCKGRYRNVAVVEWDGATYPKMISERARGVVRVIRHYGALSVGKTERCAYRRAVREAEVLVASLGGTDAGPKQLMLEVA